MIKLVNEVKHFGKGTTLVKALNGVSFDLPDSGFVFVVGKSGSGKSTLMSILGGLADTTKGSVIVDGVDITKIKNTELDKYRNNYIGVIYQSFNLFENETVYSNILSTLEISENKLSENEIDNVLKKLDLETKKNALARELSGGQKQRVAIARALVKNPEVILADEPTGNLDSKTTTSILNILQKISKTKLVVIISHDLANAKKYADRIITLSDGLVVSDQIRNKDYIHDEKSILVSDETNNALINKVNKQLNGEARLNKEDNRFIDFNEEVTSTHKKADFGKIKHSLRIPLKLSGGFLKSTLPSFIITLILSTLIVGLLAMAHNFTTFDGQGAINDLCDRYDTNTLVMRRGYSSSGNVNDLNKDHLIKPKSDELDILKKQYKGNVYEYYNVPLWITSKQLEREETTERSPYSTFYATTGEGVVCVDDSYLSRIYPGYELLAGSIELTRNTSDIIVTDYFADSIINWSKVSSAWSDRTSDDPNDPYQKIVGTTISKRYRIGAVISTGYMKRYGAIVKMLERISLDRAHASEYYEQLYSSDLYLKFINEAQSKLNYAYTVNKNFYNQYLDDYSSNDGYIAYVRNSTLYKLDGTVITTYSTSDYAKCSTAGGTMTNSFYVNFYIFNLWFGTNITSIDSPDYEIKDIRVDMLGYDQKITDEPDLSRVFHLVPAPFITSNDLYASPDVIRLFKEQTVHVCGYIFDSPEGFHNVYKNGKSYFYYTPSSVFKPVFEVIDIVNVFSSIFFLVAGVLIGLVLIVVIYHNIRVVKNNQYRIGVYKSLGYTNSKITGGAVLNAIYLFVGIFVASFAATYLLSGTVNKLLGKSFSNFLGSEIFSQLSLIYFNIWQLLLYMGVIIIVSLISLLAPIIRIRNTKPNEIINKAE